MSKRAISRTALPPPRPASHDGTRCNKRGERGERDGGQREKKKKKKAREDKREERDGDDVYVCRHGSRVTLLLCRWRCEGPETLRCGGALRYCQEEQALWSRSTCVKSSHCRGNLSVWGTLFIEWSHLFACRNLWYLGVSQRSTPMISPFFVQLTYPHCSEFYIRRCPPSSSNACRRVVSNGRPPRHKLSLGALVAITPLMESLVRWSVQPRSKGRPNCTSRAFCPAAADMP